MTANFKTFPMDAQATAPLLEPTREAALWSAGTSLSRRRRTGTRRAHLPSARRLGEHHERFPTEVRGEDSGMLPPQPVFFRGFRRESHRRQASPRDPRTCGQSRRRECKTGTTGDLTWDANLTVQTRRRYLSSMPSAVEELRKKYCVMTHSGFWPRCVSPVVSCARTLTDERTWNTFLEELLIREKFNFQREIEV